MIDILLVIVGVISNNITCAKEALKLNEKKLCILYLNIAEAWLGDLEKIIKENMI